jgi:hypothetical protein
MIGGITQSHTASRARALSLRAEGARTAAALAVAQEKSAQAKVQSGAEPCRTCAARTYVDGSTDLGVSFKSPTHVSPGASFAAVSAHEGEHVARAQSRAEAADLQVVASSVTLFAGHCSECGRTYTAGGVTRTILAAPATGKVMDAWG